MSENYKITKEIGLRILELRNEGLTFPKISAQIKAEFDVDVLRSSIERFYKNFLKGSSRILPKEIIGFEIKNTGFTQKTYHSKDKSQPVQTVAEDFSDSALLAQLSNGKNINKASKPDEDILSLYSPKPLIK